MKKILSFSRFRTGLCFFSTLRIWILLVLVSLWILPAQAASQRFSFNFRLSPLSNLVYQLDCLTVLPHCSRQAYQQLWQGMGWNAEDDRKLAIWRSIQQKYIRQQIEMSPALSFQVGFPLRFEGLQIGDKLRIASFQADTLINYSQQLTLLTTPSDAAQLLDTLQYFTPRFQKWWLQTGQKQGQKYMPTFVALFKQPGIVAYIEQVATFYQATLPAKTELPLNFMVRPQTGIPHTNGEQVESQAVIETLDGIKPERLLGVILHEMFHYFYDNAPYKHHAQLVQRFTSISSPNALTAYNLLDEGLATALGNGLLLKQWMSEAEFQEYLLKNNLYDDWYIDRSAKALIPLVNYYLKQGKNLYDPTFPQSYVLTLEKSLGAELNRPQPLLRTLGTVATDPTLKPLLQQLYSDIRPNTIRNSSDSKLFGRYPYLSGVVFTTPEGISQLDIDPVLRQSLQTTTQSYTGFVYGWPRSPQAHLFFFVAREPDIFQALIQQFIRSEKRFQGVGASVQSMPL